MKELHFTPVFEDIRAALDVTRDEYALCNYIQIWGSFPKAKYRGYCDRTQQEMAEFVGITRMGLRKMLTRLTGRGLLVFCPSIHLYEVSDIWFDAVNTRSKSKQSLPIDEVNKVDESKQSLQAKVNKVDIAPIYSKKNSNKMEGVTPNGEPSPPAFSLESLEGKTPTSKPKGQENKQEKQRAVSTKVKSKFIPFSESLSSPTAATDFKEFLQTYADGIYKHADAVFYVAKALQWVSNTPAGAKAKYADWRVALAGWCRTDGVKAAPQAQHTPPTAAEIGTAKRNAHLEELQKRGFVPEQKGMIAPWRYYEENEIIARHNIRRNCKRKELNS